MARSIHSQAYELLIEQLRELRENARITQQELADRIGHGQTWVSKVEVGERRLDVEEFRLFCEGVGADPRKVFDRWLRSVHG